MQYILIWNKQQGGLSILYFKALSYRWLFTLVFFNLQKDSFISIGFIYFFDFLTWFLENILSFFPFILLSHHNSCSKGSKQCPRRLNWWEEYIRCWNFLLARGSLKWVSSKALSQEVFCNENFITHEALRNNTSSTLEAILKIIETNPCSF